MWNGDLRSTIEETCADQESYQRCEWEVGTSEEAAVKAKFQELQADYEKAVKDGNDGLLQSVTKAVRDAAKESKLPESLSHYVDYAKWDVIDIMRDKWDRTW